jgi:putative ABC transport system permease protein
MRLQFLTWRQWRARPGRLLLTILSVAIAVAAVLGTSFAQSSVRRAYHEMNAALEGPPILDVVAREGGRFPLDGAPTFNRLEGTASVTALLFRATSVRVSGKSWRTLSVGIDDQANSTWSRLRLVDGRLPQGDGEALLDASWADRLGIQVPQRVIVLARRGTAALSVVGTVTPDSLRGFDEGASLLVPLATAHRVFGFSGQVDRIRIEATSADARERLLEDVAARLPDHLTVQRPAGRLRLADEILRSAELALRFAGVLAMMMAGFIILNTLRMNFTERRREFSIMRALGASERQLWRLLWMEALSLGCLGAVVGVPMGLLMARGVAQATQALLGEQAQSGWPHPGLIALGILVGPAVSLVAAWFPAREARLLSPLEGISDIDPAAVDTPSRRAMLIGLLLWASAAVCLALVVRESLPSAVAIPAGLAMLVGFILLIPTVLGALVACVSALAPQQVQAEALVAQRQIQERRTRSTLTIGVLVVALNNGVGLGHAILNNVDDVRTWYRRNMSGDYVLRPFAANTWDDPVESEEVTIAEMRSDSAVAGVTTVRLRNGRVQGEPALCVIRDFAADGVLPWNLTPLGESALRRQLADGQVALSTVIARRLRLAPGDSLRLELQGRTHPVTVAAVVNDYTLGGMAIFLDRKTAGRLSDLGPVDLYLISCANGQAEDAKATLTNIAEKNKLALQSFPSLRRDLDRLIGGITGALYGLLALGFLIGGFGVANTLAMSVLEQTRQIGLLRIVGMSQRQLGRLIFVESIFLGLVSALLGVLAGLTTASIIHLCNRPLLDRDVPFQFRIGLLLLNVVSCLLVAALAAWMPGRRAAHIDQLSAIAYE